MEKLLKISKLRQVVAFFMVLTLVMGMVNLSAFRVNADDSLTPQQKLEALLDEIYALNSSDYTEESWNELKETADSVVRPVTPYDETTGDGMPDWVANYMINSLTELKNNLVKNPTPQENLEALLDEIYALNSSDYTEESWNELKETADSVVRPVTPYDETTGDGMPDWVANYMINALTDLKNNLIKADTKTIYEKLEEKLKEAEALNASDYTEESWAGVQDIIDSVVRPVSSSNIIEKLATKMLSELENAMAALELKPDDAISLDDGTYYAVISHEESTLLNYAKIVAKDHKYNVTLYTEVKSFQKFDGGMNDNNIYTLYDYRDYTFPEIEVVKPEYNSQFENGNEFSKFSMKNLEKDYNLQETSYKDEIKKAFSSDNDYMFFDSSYETLSDNSVAMTFETDELDSSFIVNGLYNLDYHNSDGTIDRTNYWALYDTITFDKNNIVSVPDDYMKLDGSTYVKTEAPSDRNSSERNLSRKPFAQIKLENGKLYVTYSLDLKAFVNNVEGAQSADIYDIAGNKLEVINDEVTLEYSSYDELISGKHIFLRTSIVDSSRGAYVRDYDYTFGVDFTATPVTISDNVTGIKLYSTSKFISDNAKLNVSLVKDTGSTDTDKDPWANAMSKLPKYNKMYFFTFNVTDGGNQINDFGGYVSIDVPKVEELNDSSLRLFLNKYLEDYKYLAFGWFNEYIVAHDDNYTLLLDSDYFDGNWLIYDEKVADTDGSGLADGTYTVPITTFNEAQPSQTSMSAQCLGETATLVVKNGVKRLELDFKSVNIGALDGYLIQMWDKEADGSYKELTYTSYYKNEDGSYFTDELNAGTNNYYPKTGYMILPTDAAQFTTKFRVSAMDAIMGDNGDATRDAIFTIYYDQAQKISDETPDPAEEEIPNFKEADKSKLNELIASAEKIAGDAYTDSSFNTLTSVLASAKTISDNKKATQTEVDNVYNELKSAIDGLVKKEQTGLDYKNLPDGVYSLNINMVKVDKKTASMSDGAVNHIIKLTVKDGKYYITVNFKGLSIGSDFGYLKELKYYLTGYTMDQYGNPMGTLADTVIEGYQKNTDGTLVSDRYGTDYPNALTFEMIPEALEDGYVPLQVFVPIMEAIAEGNGDQNVFMKLDWTSLKKTTEDDDSFKPQDPVEQSPAVDAADSATGVKVHADKGVFEAGVKLVVNPITAGDVYNKAANSLADIGNKFRLYEVHFDNTQGQEVQPNGTVTVYYPVPEGFDVNNLALYRINEDGTKTLVKGVVEDGYYKVVTKSFSTYALVDKGSTDNTSDAADSSASASDVATGDANNLVLWMMLLGVSLGAGAATVAFKRRRLIGE